MNIIKFFKDKMQAYRVARQAGALREYALFKNNGETNTYVSAKERDRRKTLKKIAKKARRRNRK